MDWPIEERVVDDEKDVLKAVVRPAWIQRVGAEYVPRRYGARLGCHAGDLLGVLLGVVDVNVVLDCELNTCACFLFMAQSTETSLFTPSSSSDGSKS